MIAECGACGSTKLRTFSRYVNGSWQWWKGCNACSWEAQDPDEEVKHEEYYKRGELSPAKISDNDVSVKP